MQSKVTKQKKAMKRARKKAKRESEIDDKKK